MKSIADTYKFKEGQDLANFDPNDISAFPAGRTAAEEELFVIRAEFDDLQELLHAQGKYRILIILQGVDGSGKDSLIRGVFRGVNPKGCLVSNFKQPIGEELMHDYLWRCHQKVPKNGEIVIFNRSYFEDIIVPSVHNSLPKKLWEKRYEHINAFEKLLTDEGTIVLKFFLNISKKEQKRRLKARLSDPTKGWKVSESDFKERKLWDEYQITFNNVFKKTSTKNAYWYIIPSNNKWYRNLVVVSILLKTLKDLHITYPKINPKLKKMKLT